MKYFQKVSITMIAAVFTVVETTMTGQAITTPGDPSQYITPTDSYSGVPFLELQKSSGEAFCTGSLLPGGSYILTAAHCVTDSENQGVFDTIATTVDFSKQSTSQFKTSVTDYFINPGWTGVNVGGKDIAVLKLAEQAPANIQQYDINRVNDEVGKVFTAVGFGYSGTGNTGVTMYDGAKRSGLNRYDDTASDLNDTVLFADFDNGNSANDFLGQSPGLNDTGLGTQEVGPASGDSGGPGLIDGKIAGIVSFAISDCGLPTGCVTDINTTLDSSFGELFGYTRVSSYSNFIDDAVAGRIVATASVPEPSTNLGLIVFGAGTIFAMRKRHRSMSKVAPVKEN